MQAKDYKNRARTQTKGHQQTPGWVWFIAGLLVGLFFSGLAWLKLLPAPEQLAREPAQISPKPAQEDRKEARKTEENKAPATKPRFDFYTILPETEVVVPEPEAEAEPEPTVKPPIKTTRNRPAESRQQAVDGERYMLQMGSFHKFSDADRMKASLALVGIEAEIQRVNINSGELFHRVRSGPHNKEKLNALRGRLKQNGINSLVIKLK